MTCNAVCPGYMLTELVEKQLAATAKLRGMSEVRRKAPGLLCASGRAVVFPCPWAHGRVNPTCKCAGRHAG